jgi:diguanylate cyclase (GGDEF)-like protein
MEPYVVQDVENEIDYRQHFLQADIRLSIKVIMVWLMAVLIFIPVDYATLGFTREFFIFLAARLLFITCILVVVYGLRRTTKPRQFDILISCVLLLGVAFSFFGHIFNEQDCISQLILDVLIIITIYAIFPGPISMKVIASLLLSAKTILSLSDHEQLLTNSEISVTIGIVMINLIGYYSWSAISNFRHQQFALHAELKQAQKDAEYLARIDPLTEINNRRAFMELGQEEFSRSTRYKHLLSLVTIDIDNFKSINDKYGHQAGDQMLKDFTKSFGKQIREQDILGRIGGDEFGLLLPETNLEEAQAITSRLYEIFRQKVFSFQKTKISISFSAGVATIQPSDRSFEQLLKRSDQNLYHAKDSIDGRNES